MERIQLGNTVFEGANNVYLLQGDETVLVDAGVATEPTRGEFVDGLASFGVTPEDVDRVFLTHWHYDHAGLAGMIQQAGGATVHVHEADAELVSGEEASLIEDRTLQQETFEAWQLPDGPREELLSFLEGHAELAGEDVDVTPFSGGDRFAVNGFELEAVHLPGHSAGLSAFAFEDDGERQAFVGDAILPKYTPNVGGADVRVESPLAKYVDSLVEVVERDWDRALPGHRDTIEEPAERAREIIGHHRERTERVVDVLDRHGACDVWTVSHHLFGELDTIHILHGPGEAFAHLDHLARHGVVEREATDYRLAVDEPDVGALFPDP
ncbi:MULTISPECIES: MBL fold metallo-hydrolase [Halolamina]|uniref:Glyoxylase, beta-lactamase superfamily II n=1 Tax=Halolamina pelagica TaxID=699431 RepID=A0A1I5N027_9EURY|nr:MULTISPECIES: MBL fold metallo-hydrolase [Halolamina]NHX36244.1 MBL fold metallo-hydrolase [Halolamina sp. R1-12]SFP15148.1 Glyoxylase, beta-lactamase superfamily II [Halolamina pelagica]